MKLTKSRFQKVLHKNGNQTRKKYKTQMKILTHKNTVRNNSSLGKSFHLHNKTMRLYNK
jgi:hypothetical protein